MDSHPQPRPACRRPLAAAPAFPPPAAHTRRSTIPRRRSDRGTGAADGLPPAAATRVPLAPGRRAGVPAGRGAHQAQPPTQAAFKHWYGGRS